jgi:hypothetical protein
VGARALRDRQFLEITRPRAAYARVVALSPPPAPRVARWALAGLVACGLVGAVAGLVIGLRVHPATAWFAAFELGLPAAVVGALGGAAAGAIASVVHRLRVGTELE